MKTIKNIALGILSTGVVFVSAQNVGINTDGSTPGMMLDIKVPSGNDGIRINNNSGTGDAMINLQDAGTSRWTFGLDASNGNRFVFDNGGSLSTTNVMVLETGGDVGIGLNNPDDKLDVSGNAQVSGYLKVGNPSTPSTLPSSSRNMFWQWANTGGFYPFEYASTCGGTNWSYTIATNPIDNNLKFDNPGSRERSHAYCPWIWIPSGASNVYFEPQHDINGIENGYDGVFMEYSTDGVTWSLLNFTFQGYTDNTTAGSNTACSGNANTPAWEGNVGSYSSTSQDLSALANGAWIRLRFTGFSDGSNGSGDWQLWGAQISGILPATVGGAFTSGEIYAEGNVYAGSNVLLGDLAEYFKVNTKAEPGDLITMKEGEHEEYSVSSKEYDDKVIGIYSTAPTLTLNNPNSGVPVGLQGRVPVKVFGSVKKGDYLTASSLKGHAKKADKACYVVGRALEDFNGKTGKVLCLIETGWYNPSVVEGNYSSGKIDVTSSSNDIRIINNSISENSRVFITMLGDAGARYWVSDIEEGSFTLSFSEPSNSNFSFNYLIENANLNSAEEVLIADHQELKIQEVKSILDDGGLIDLSTIDYFKKGDKIYASDGTEIPVDKIYEEEVERDGEVKELREYTGAMPPSSVPDPSSVYYWTEYEGLIMTIPGKKTE